MSHCGAKTKGSVPTQEEGGGGTGKEVQTDSFMQIYRGSKSRKFQKETIKMRKIRSLTGLNLLIYEVFNLILLPHARISREKLDDDGSASLDDFLATFTK